MSLPFYPPGFMYICLPDHLFTWRKGTPSDLLPEELGRCDYETGDDGMMISTVLDRKVASYEFMQVREVK